MTFAQRKLLQPRNSVIRISHVDARSPRRPEVEAFIRDKFLRHYDASVSVFAPNLLLIESGEQIVAATGWRSAASGRLFLEHYLDEPVERTLSVRAGRAVARERIVEVGNLAADKAGGSVHVILALADYLDGLGHEWVVFTATQELIGIFARLGLPLLALGQADPERLGAAARDWGRYYDTRPVVVAGRIRLALERAAGRHA